MQALRPKTAPKRKDLDHIKFHKLIMALDPAAPACFHDFTDGQLASKMEEKLGFPISGSSVQLVRCSHYGIVGPARTTSSGGRLERLEMGMNYLVDLLSEELNELEIETLKQILKGERCN